MPSILPHPKASAVLSELGGIRLVPIDDQDGQASDVRFVLCEAPGYESHISYLGTLLNRKFYPIAELADGYGILIMDEIGENFAIGTSSLDVHYLGELRGAIFTCLTGKRLLPVLPIRAYPQWHNVDIYPPQSPDVYWVDTPEWIQETRAEESKE